MKAYWITLCQVTDDEGYGEYIKLAGPAIEKFGGKFLARGGKQKKFEGESYDRTVVVEFNSLETAKNAYESDDYKEALKFSSKSANRHVVVVEAL
jgi:uncharacterized protein (DUF1330 family)|uniref:DUF1330 domain-containing protein n=1 Tax=uncultured marine bacterium EB0_39H12 TaxID=415437 RepID=A4GHY4_9BACT|nr:hypothetical protein MBMO_EB0-39H12.0071 [uncultured marine bacterium EB0_39H12]